MNDRTRLNEKKESKRSIKAKKANIIYTLKVTNIWKT